MVPRLLVSISAPQTEPLIGPLPLEIVEHNHGAIDFDRRQIEALRTGSSSVSEQA